MLAILVVAAILSFVDRQILSLLVEPIKRDLHIDDFAIASNREFTHRNHHPVGQIRRAIARGGLFLKVCDLLRG